MSVVGFSFSPTAQASLAERALTPASTSRDPPGMATRDQVLPFQCSVRSPPTAHASVADTALTPFRWLLTEDVVGVDGLGTLLQEWPFQCTISVAYLLRLGQ